MTGSRPGTMTQIFRLHIRRVLLYPLSYGGGPPSLIRAGLSAASAGSPHEARFRLHSPYCVTAIMTSPSTQVVECPLPEVSSVSTASPTPKRRTSPAETVTSNVPLRMTISCLLGAGCASLVHPFGNRRKTKDVAVAGFDTSTAGAGGANSTIDMGREVVPKHARPAASANSRVSSRVIVVIL